MPSEPIRFSVKFTLDFLHRSTARRIFRKWWQLVLGAVLILTSILMDAKRGKFGKLSAAAATLLAVVILFYGMLWLRQVKRNRKWCAKQGSDPLVYTLSEDTLEAISASGTVALKWDIFQRMKITALDLRLYNEGNRALSLPTDQVPPEAIEFLKRKFQDSGKRVEDERK